MGFFGLRLRRPLRLAARPRRHFRHQRLSRAPESQSHRTLFRSLVARFHRAHLRHPCQSRRRPLSCFSCRQAQPPSTLSAMSSSQSSSCISVPTPQPKVLEGAPSFAVFAKGGLLRANATMFRSFLTSFTSFTSLPPLRCRHRSCRMQLPPQQNPLPQRPLLHRSSSILRRRQNKTLPHPLFPPRTRRQRTVLRPLPARGT